MEKTYRKNIEGNLVEVIPQEVIPEKEIVVDLSGVRAEMAQYDKDIIENQREADYYVANNQKIIDKYQAEIAAINAKKAELQAKLDKAVELDIKETVEISTGEVIEEIV